MPKCLLCGVELVKPEDFSLGDLSKNLCAQCSRPRVSQHRHKPWEDTSLHKKFGAVKPPSEGQVHEVYVRRLREMGRTDEEINKELKKWHEEQSS